MCNMPKIRVNIVKYIPESTNKEAGKGKVIHLWSNNGYLMYLLVICLIFEIIRRVEEAPVTRHNCTVIIESKIRKITTKGEFALAPKSYRRLYIDLGLLFVYKIAKRTIRKKVSGRATVIRSYLGYNRLYSFKKKGLLLHTYIYTYIDIQHIIYIYSYVYKITIFIRTAVVWNVLQIIDYWSFERVNIFLIRLLLLLLRLPVIVVAVIGLCFFSFG